ncbi:hypothetical protein V8C35DRAFT_307993 [Trichoderma chlorosporum]
MRLLLYQGSCCGHSGRTMARARRSSCLAAGANWYHSTASLQGTVQSPISSPRTEARSPAWNHRCNGERRRKSGTAIELRTVRYSLYKCCSGKTWDTESTLFRSKAL